MTEIMITADEATTRAEFHSVIAQKLSFPDYYGENLDALHDCLTDICSETTIHIVGFERMRDNLGNFAKSLSRVLTASADENPKLNVIIEE